MGIIQDYRVIGPELAGTYMQSDEFDHPPTMEKRK
jgi:hypothetical protein